MGSRRHRFFLSVCLSGRDRCIFCRRRTQTRPHCAAVHSLFHTEKILQLSQNSGAHCFLFVQCSKNAGVAVSTVVNRRKAISGQIYRKERLSISGNSGEDRAHIARVSLLLQPNVATTIDQHISNSDPITAIHIPPTKCFQTNFWCLCADLLAFVLNGEVV